MIDTPLPKIAEVVLDLPLDGPFDYFIPESLRNDIRVGMRVKILFNRKKHIGFVVDFKHKSAFPKLNPILDLLDDTLIFKPEIMAFLKEFAEVTACSLGEALSTYLPEGLRRGNIRFSAVEEAQDGRAPIERKSILLLDLTENKKWDVLQDEIKRCLEGGQGVIVLVPEMAYFDIWEKKLKTTELSKFPLALWGGPRKHTVKEQLALWSAIFKGEYPLVLGTRSGVFLPVKDLGLIVVSEENSQHYKQEQVPHYHAVEAACLRSQYQKTSIILESIAPRAVSWQRALREKWDMRQLEAAQSASMHVVDMSNYNPTRSSLISFPLQNAIQDTILKGGKILLYLNQVGFTTLTRCNQCAFTLKCQRCNSNLIYLYSKKKMVCRRCHQESELPKICPQCNGNYLRSTGSGLEKIESEVARFYPQVKISRYEGETENYPKDAQIVLATQAVLKKMDTIQADMVAFIKFDLHLNRPDYRSSEEAFGLLLRFKHFARSKLLVQTHMPDHYAIKAAAHDDLKSFYTKELKFRKEVKLPPFAHIVQITLRGKKEEAVFEHSQKIFEQLSAAPPKALEIVETHPDAVAKLRDNFRFNIEVKGKSVKNTLSFTKKALKKTKRGYGIITTLNVDP